MKDFDDTLPGIFACQQKWKITTCNEKAKRIYSEDTVLSVDKIGFIVDGYQSQCTTLK